MRLIDEVRPVEGARDLISALKHRGHTVVLASSAKEREVEHYLTLLDARDLADAWTTSADVDRTKPAPDLVDAALNAVRARADSAVMIGDTPWDVESAHHAGVETITVVTGGFSEQELEDAGAVAVFASVTDLCAQLDQTRLR
jgi:HAD superfamily hydrolase (TIGR01509 family)